MTVINLFRSSRLVVVTSLLVLLLSILSLFLFVFTQIMRHIFYTMSDTIPKIFPLFLLVLSGGYMITFIFCSQGKTKL